MKRINLVNIILLSLALVLLINFFYSITLITGNLVYSLDPSSPECYFSYSNNLNEIPIDMCCSEIQKQLFCERSDNFYVGCFTSEDAKYLLNKKAFNYCKIEGYDAKIK